MKALFCKTCGARLTEPLDLVSGKDPSVATPEMKDGEPATARGIAFKSYDPIMRSYGERPALLEFVPQLWINPADLTGAVRPTERTSRLSGCCGPSGIDGPNQVCTCGAEIGTLQADCWTPLIFIAEPDSTEWTEIR